MIPALEHEYELTEETEASCTESGVKTFTCKNCGDAYEEEVEATGHQEGEPVVTKAGLFRDGLEEICCEKCGEVLQSEVLNRIVPLWAVVAAGALVVVAAVGTAFAMARKNNPQRIPFTGKEEKLPASASSIDFRIPQNRKELLDR